MSESLKELPVVQTIFRKALTGRIGENVSGRNYPMTVLVVRWQWQLMDRFTAPSCVADATLAASSGRHCTMSDPISKTTAIHAAKGTRIGFDYLNYREEQTRRHVEIGHVWWGITEWHPIPGWLLSAFDLEKQGWRNFAMKEMANVEAESNVR
jgi:hypothetical protein